MKKKYLVCLITAAMLLGGCGMASSTAKTPAASSSTSTAETSATDSTLPAASDVSSEIPAVSSVLPKADSTENASANADSATSDPGNTDNAPVDEAAWKTIQQYGFIDTQDEFSQAGQCSDLSFKLKADTVKDEGEYYTVEADFMKKVQIAEADLKPGNKITITLNELTGETDEITVGEDGSLTGAEGNEYYYFNNDKENGNITLYEDSDDRVDDLFYTGTLCISKDAITGAYIEQKPYETITKSTLTDDDHWFNGLYFDDRGVVVQLIFYGD